MILVVSTLKLSDPLAEVLQNIHGENHYILLLPTGFTQMCWQKVYISFIPSGADPPLASALFPVQSLYFCKRKAATIAIQTM